MIGNLISAGASLIGGMMNRDAAKDASRQAAEQARRNEEMQIAFAQKGIRWKVDDAKAAGIHPVYALGAPTTSFSPVSLSSTADTSMGSAIASAGQDIGRAVNATRTAGERSDVYTDTVKKLSLQKMGLENDLLASQIAKLKVNDNPPLPSIAPDKDAPFHVPEAKKSEERPPLMFGGQRWLTNPDNSPMQAWENQYGDDGPASWILPIMLGLSDMKYNWTRRIPAVDRSQVRRGDSFFDWWKRNR